MKSKAAIQTVHGQRIVVDELDIPDPQPDQVIVKLFSSGLCHSPLHDMRNPEFDRPLVLGDEGMGVVTHVGRNVNHVKEGDHVIVTWVARTPIRGRSTFPPCRVTYRSKQVYAQQLYTWGEDTLLEAEYVVPMSKEHPTDVTGIVGCAVMTGAGAVLNTARVRPGDSVAVFGVGGVGTSAVRMAAILEANPIIAVDMRDDKLEFAREFGATHGVNASKVDPVEAIVDITNGGVDFAFDAIGVRATNEQIIPATRSGGSGADNHGGMAIVIGMPREKMTLDTSILLFHQRQFRGTLGASNPERDFPMFLRWYQEGKFPLDKLVTRRYKLDQINEACDALKAGEIIGRAIIEY